MSRKSKATSISGAFVSHPLEMRESPAWRVLPDNARRVLDRLEVEHMHHGGYDNGQLKCTYADFEAAGIRRASVAQAIRDACVLGFLSVERKGYLSPKDFRVPSEYRLTYILNTRRIGEKAAAAPTHEWRSIRSDQDAEAALSRSRPSPRPNRRQSAANPDVQAA